MFRLNKFIIALLFVAVPIVHAQDDKKEQEKKTTQLEEIVVTAERIEISKDKLGSSITVITSDEINERGATSVADAIRGVISADVTQSGGAGQITTSLLRGASSTQTLVFVDGVRANSPSWGGFDFANLSVDNIERIEILRGPQSSLYGSDAIGGVINIITKKGADKPTVSISAEGGSFATFKERIESYGAIGFLDYSLTISHLNSDGISAASRLKGNDEKDGYENTTFSTRVGANFLTDGRADFTLRYITASAEFDGFTWGVGPTDSKEYTQDTRSAFGSFVVKKPISSYWEPSLKLTLSHEKLAGDDPDITWNNYVIKTTRRSAELQNVFKVSDFYTLIAGGSYETQSAINQNTFSEDTFNRAIFAENRFEFFDSLYLTAGIRQDDHSTFGDKTTYRTTAAYLMKGTDTKLHGSLGTGFRAPSLNELFYPFYGNPDLKPEKSRGYDIGVEQKLLDKKLTADITYFHNSFSDLIGTDPTTFTAANISKARSEGVEFAINWQALESISFDVSYTYNETKDLDTDKQLINRAKNKYLLVAHWKPIPQLTITSSYTIVRDRIGVGNEDMNNYALFNVAASYNVTDKFSIFGRVENLFDYKYEEVVGYSSPPLSAYIGVQMTW